MLSTPSPPPPFFFFRLFFLLIHACGVRRERECQVGGKREGDGCLRMGVLGWLSRQDAYRGLGFRVCGFRVQGFGFRVSGFGFMVSTRRTRRRRRRTSYSFNSVETKERRARSIIAHPPYTHTSTLNSRPLTQRPDKLMEQEGLSELRRITTVRAVLLPDSKQVSRV